MAQIISCCRFGHKVCKAEQEVCKCEHSALVERFYVVGGSVLEWFVPLNVYRHAERDKVLSGKLDPKISSELEHDNDESHSPQEEHYNENQQSSFPIFPFAFICILENDLSTPRMKLFITPVLWFDAGYEDVNDWKQAYHHDKGI